MNILKILHDLRVWILYSPLRSGFALYLLAPLIYVLFQAIMHLFSLENGAWGGLSKLLILNLHVSVGFLVYVWLKNKI